MKKIIIALCWLIPLLVKGQQNKEILFSTAKNWKEVLSRAKAEKKNIFIDAYATWCGPCKEMDKVVYKDPQVGEFVNSTFISVKIQFDKTANDPESIKNWYPDAAMLMENYHITAFPTFLFFNFNGELIHRATGYQPIDSFLALLKKANDRQQNYAGKIMLFRSGKLNNDALLELALATKENKEDSLAFQIAKSHKAKTVDNVEPSKILSPELLKFFGTFYELFSTDDIVIQYLYHHPDLADSALQNKGYSRSMVDYQIRRELVDQLVNPKGEFAKRKPDWNNIEKQITKRYDISTAKRLILNAKLSWYTAKKDWPNVVKYTVLKTDTIGISNDEFARAGINNMAFNIIFKRSEDPVYLKKGLAYMEMILKIEANKPHDVHLDTYANLLYKIGRKKEAIEYEEKSLKIASIKNDKSRILEYENNLKKMYNNEATWPIN